MLKYLLGCFFVFSFGLIAFAQEIEKTIKCSGAISDICLSNDKIIVATENASVDILSRKNYSLLQKIVLPNFIDFFGDSIKPHVYSVDYYNNKIVVVSQGTEGFSNVFIVNGEITTKIIDSKSTKLTIKKAVFFSDNKIVLGMLSNEIGLFNLTNMHFDYLKQISPYAFSDFDLSDDKTKIYSSDESGIVHCINALTGEVIENLLSVNVDNVYQIDCASNIVATAGKDRRLGVYNLESKNSFYLKSDFLILSLGLSADGKKVAFMSGENGDFSLFDTQNKKLIFRKDYSNSPLSKIMFLGDNKLITANEQSFLTIWKLNK